MKTFEEIYRQARLDESSLDSATKNRQECQKRIKDLEAKLQSEKEKYYDLCREEKRIKLQNYENKMAGKGYTKKVAGYNENQPEYAWYNSDGNEHDN